MARRLEAPQRDHKLNFPALQVFPQPRSWGTTSNYAARFAALRKTVVPLLTIFLNSPAKK
jgi:hypothetical protein